MGKDKALRKQKFYIIGHNAADSAHTMKPWLGSSTSHLEIDVIQTRQNFIAQHSRVKGVLSDFWLWSKGHSLERMIDMVVSTGKDIYIDYKWGNVESLVNFLDKRDVLKRTTFVIYGRHRAEHLKYITPQNDVFLHVTRFNVKLFDAKKNTNGIGVCLSAKSLTLENVAYMNKQNAEILATFVNSFPDFMRAAALDVVGITTDIPHIAQFAHQYNIQPNFTPSFQIA